MTGLDDDVRDKVIALLERTPTPEIKSLAFNERLRYSSLRQIVEYVEQGV